jgi:transposase
MLTPPAGLKVYVATKPVDFRKGAEGLALFAKDVLGQDPLSGVALVFRAKRADRVKILAWDGSGRRLPVHQRSAFILQLFHLQLTVLPGLHFACVRRRDR